MRMMQRTTKKVLDNVLKYVRTCAFSITYLAFLTTPASPMMFDHFVEAPKQKIVVQSPVSQKEMLCLAQNLFYEARGTDFHEMVNISNIVLNRSKDGRYPTEPCKVVFEAQQFSWTSDHRNNINKINALIRKDQQEYTAWLMAKQVATLALSHKLRDTTGGAIAYNAVYIKKPVSSFWRSTITTLKTPYHVYYARR